MLTLVIGESLPLIMDLRSERNDGRTQTIGRWSWSEPLFCFCEALGCIGCSENEAIIASLPRISGPRYSGILIGCSPATYIEGFGSDTIYCTHPWCVRIPVLRVIEQPVPLRFDGWIQSKGVVGNGPSLCERPCIPECPGDIRQMQGQW